MAASGNPLKILPSGSRGPGSQDAVLAESSNEFIFAVVGHAGSGTSVVAESLKDLLRQNFIGTHRIDAEILKARTVIEEWATKTDRTLPEGSRYQEPR